MASTVLTLRTNPPTKEGLKLQSVGGSESESLSPDNASGDWEPHQPDSGTLTVQRYKFGVWIACGGIAMVFAAFTSALVVRKGLGNDWNPIQPPGILWFSTLVLFASSLTVSKAKRALWSGLDEDLRRWLSVTALLGGVFLTAQCIAWNQLLAAGIYVSSNPSSSFFYLLTAAHGLHLLGGVVAMVSVAWRVRQSQTWITRNAAVESTALYWHLMSALWVYLFVLLMVWR